MPTKPEAARERVSETTRFLCAGAYLDSSFSDFVRRLVFEQDYRAVAPSYGIDVELVAKHCFAACRRRTIRNVTIVVLCLISIVVAPRNSVESFWFFYLFFGAAVSVYLVDRWYVRLVIIGRRFSRSRFHAKPDAPLVSARVQQRLNEFVKNGQSNLVLYSGFTPFVGAGTLLSGWSFAINLRRGRRYLDKESSPTRCTLGELYSRVISGVQDLEILGLTTEELVFVNGQDARLDSAILAPGSVRPSSALPAEDVARFALNLSTVGRHYHCIRVTDWSGELVLSIFLRMRKISENLFAEVSYFLLGPAKEEFRQCDSPPRVTSMLEVLTSAIYAAVATPFVAVASFLGALGFVPELVRKHLEADRLKRRARNDATFDFGAIDSIRQKGSSSNVRRYFQHLDKEMYLKVLERRILDSLVDCLDEHGIETSDLKERQSMILNSGVIVTGSVNAGTFVGGQGAKSTIQGISNAAAARVGEVLARNHSAQSSR